MLQNNKTLRLFCQSFVVTIIISLSVLSRSLSLPFSSSLSLSPFCVRKQKVCENENRSFSFLKVGRRDGVWSISGNRFKIRLASTSSQERKKNIFKHFFVFPVHPSRLGNFSLKHVSPVHLNQFCYLHLQRYMVKFSRE